MKSIFTLIGIISLVLGIVGIALPVLPTTPFILLSATLFMHSSPKLYDRLINHKYLGEPIRNYRENRTIPLRAKILAVTMLWTTILMSVFQVVYHNIYIQVLLIVIAIAVSWHILSHKTTPREK